MNYRKLRHELTDTVAVWLHYIENVGKVDYWSDTQPDSNKTASEVISEQTGGVHRYRTDALFHAKVDCLVARLLSIIEDHYPPLTPPNQ